MPYLLHAFIMSMKYKPFYKFTALAGLCALCVVSGVSIWSGSGPAPATGTPQSWSSPRSSLAVDPEAISSPDLRARIESAAAEDYPELMTVLLELGDQPAAQALMEELIRRWLNADPESFSVFLDDTEVEDEAGLSRLAPAFIAALGKVDADVSQSFVLQGLVERMVSAIAGTDPRKALVWAREWLNGSYLDSAIAGIASHLAGTDSAAAIALVDEIDALSNRMDASIGVGTVLGEREPEIGLQWARSFILESERAFAMSGVLTGLANRDSRRAADEYAGTVAAMKESYRAQVLADRAAAGTEVEEEYEGLSPEEIVKAELARPNPSLIYMERAAYVIGMMLAGEDTQGALDWANSLDIYQGRVTAMEAIYEEWGAISPDAAFASFKSGSERRPEVAGKLFGAWASNDPAAASAAAASLPPGSERDSAIEGVALGWIDHGATPEALVEWSDGLGGSNERDAVRAIAAR